MKLVQAALFLSVAFCVSATAPQPASAQAQTTFSDPANLRGERVAPRDGRELPIDSGTLGLEQLLRRLSTRASILNIVAHPDDEDGGMLTLYSRGLGARVADLSLTRGEGGQNAMTGDFEDALGLLRTQELLASDRYTGVSQFFGTEVDFGFSKTKSEAFSKWGHQRVLYDVVRAIRLYRPLVITSTWIGGVTDGHGQHQVAGEIAQEAFVAAGDPNVFPELTRQGILPWQPLRIYARVPRQSITPKGLFDYATGQYVPAAFTNYVTGQLSTTPPSTDVVVHEGQTDPLLTPAAANPADLANTHIDTTANAALTYVQFARIGLGLQRSQIPAGFRIPPAGTFDVPYHLYGSCLTTDLRACHPERSEGPASGAPTTLSSRPKAAHSAAAAERPLYSAAAALPPASDPNFFTGIDTSLTGIASLAPSAPPFLSSQLALLQSKIQTATSSLDPQDLSKVAPTLADALQTCDALIGRLSSLVMEDSQKASVLHELRIKRVQLNDALALALNLHLEARLTPPTPNATPDALLHPAPLNELPGLHNITPLEPADLVSQLTGNLVAIQQLHSTIQLNGRTTLCDGCGDVLPREGPPVTAHINDGFTTPRNTPITRPYFTRYSIEQPVYQLLDPDLRNAPQTPAPITLTRELNYNGVTLSLSAVVEANTPATGPQPVSIVPTTHTYRAIGYGDLPRTIFYPRPAPHLDTTHLKLPTGPSGAKLRLAYLPGTGDAVPEALASLGLKPTILTVADLTPATLTHFDTVVLGVRTYAAHPNLHGAPTQALLDFARHGGNVVVQYQTDEFTAADAPYPLTLGPTAEKVVDETDPVQLLVAQNPLLTTPNRITPADFNGWVEERGHGFLSTWDPRYTALTSVHDPGAPAEHVLPQAPQRGGLITTQLGLPTAKQGRWTYVAFALYRQLPEAVPGAFRLFLNLLQP